MTPVDAGKRLVIVGATGMVGGYALRYVLDGTPRPSDQLPPWRFDYLLYA